MKKEEYTYADVIIAPNDERVKVGEKYYFANTPKELVKVANHEGIVPLTLELIARDKERPFSTSTEHGHYEGMFIIKAKEPQGEYVPFDLSKKEVRDKLRGQWIVDKEEKSELCINNFKHNEKIDEWSVQDCFTGDYITPFGLLTCYTFLDGTPCGEKVEE